MKFSENIINQILFEFNDNNMSKSYYMNNDWDVIDISHDNFITFCVHRGKTVIKLPKHLFNKEEIIDSMISYEICQYIDMVTRNMSDNINLKYSDFERYIESSMKQGMLLNEKINNVKQIL